MSTRVVHCKKEPFDVYIGRGDDSIWGNPYTHKPGIPNTILVESREEAVACFLAYIRQRPDLLARLGELKGKVLGCWCKPKLCHGDVLAKLADQFKEEENDEKR